MGRDPLFIIFLDLCIYECFAYIYVHVCTCTTCVLSTQGGQKKASDSPMLQLQVVVSSNVGTENGILVLQRSFNSDKINLKLDCITLEMHTQNMNSTI